MRSFREKLGEVLVKCSNCDTCIIYTKEDLHDVEYVDENTGTFGKCYGLVCPSCTRVYTAGELRYIEKYKSKRNLWQIIKELFNA